MNIKQNSPLITAMSLCALLSACGGSSSDGGNTTPPSTPINVALPANGATVTATYANGVMANFVNDGESTNTNNFWSGLVADDKVIIDFGKNRAVTNLTVYTNDTSYSSNPSKYIEVSADNVAWKTTAQLIGGDIGCTTISIGDGKISCTFLTAQTIRYFRVRVSGATPGAIKIYEMEATGV